MRTHVWSLVVLAATITSIAPSNVSGQERPAASATIGQISWLAGDWVGDGNGLTYEERWSAAAGGAMLATSRTVHSQSMVAFEYLRIVERSGGLVYIAQPNGRPPTEFVLTELSNNTATFENPSHDFPKMIRYMLKPDNTLEARVSDGGQRGETFVFRRGPRT